MSHSWLAYLPPHLAADLVIHPEASPLKRVMRSQAVALCACISGFIPMSEALGKLGPRGSEEISQILNRTFDALIEIIYAADGSIGKLTGDVLVVVFQEPRADNRELRIADEAQNMASLAPTTVRRAIQCALDMQATLKRNEEISTSAGTFQLTMKIGLGMGDLLTTTFGDPSIRLEYILAGSAIDRSVDAEQHASKGSVVVCDALLAFADARDPSPIAPGFSIVTKLRRRPNPAPSLPLPDPPSQTIATITHYLPHTIAERLVQNQPDLVDEHRTITTLFVRFAGFDHQAPTMVNRLQSYLQKVVRIGDRYGGHLHQIDVGDKSSLFIVLFGAPVAHTDDAERALLCALELRATASQLGVVTTTGITTGRVFWGLVGSDRRREYVAIGDSVSLANRLMSAAQIDQILVDAATRQRVGSSFGWKDRSPIIVKGKTAPVEVAVLERRRQRTATRLRAPGYSLPMVGRQNELARCLQLLDQVQQGHGQIIGITAEAGMGKSRLVAEFMRSVATRRLAYFTSECLSYGTQSNYLVWRNLLHGLFDLTPGMPVDTQIQRIREVLTTIDSTLLERMPLLRTVFHIPIEETNLTRNLDPELRKLSLESLLITCFRYWANQRPLLLVLEDCHWIDPLSDDLLFALAHNVSDLSLLVLITHRPLTTQQTDAAPILRARRLPCYQELALQAFNRTETQQLIGLKLRQLFGVSDGLPSPVLDRIAERAQGSPFYIDELLNLLHDRDIDVRNANALAHIELPDSVQQLILSRIDLLEEGSKTTLKMASIIGRLFKAQWLGQVAPELGTTAQVQIHLARLQQRDFMQVERSEPELEYLFKHLITRDVVYEGLAVATRAVLHEQAGAFIERTYAQDLGRWVDLLVYHYGNSTNVSKQREYFRKAGDMARQAYANQAAIHYYQQLLEVLPEDQQGAIFVTLSLAEQQIGLLQIAEQHARVALDLARRQDDHVLAVQSITALGRVLRYTGQLDQALALLEPVYRQPQTLEPHSRLDLLQELGDVLAYQRRFDEALTLQEERLKLATTLHIPTHMGEALNNIGVVHGGLGHHTQAIPCLEQALALATAHDILRLKLTSLGNLGIMYTMLGEHLRALEFYQHQLDAVLRIGHQDGGMHPLMGDQHALDMQKLLQRGDRSL